MITTQLQTSMFKDVRFPDPSAEDIVAMLAASVVSIDVEVETDPAKGIGYSHPSVPRRDYGLSYSAPITFLAVAWQDQQTLQPVSRVFQAPFSEVAVSFIQELLCKDRRTLVGHNAGYDIRALAKHVNDFAVTQVWCTATLARLLTPELGKFDLVTVAKHYNIEVPEFILGMKAKRASLSAEDPQDVWDYVTWDALTALNIYLQQSKAIDDGDLAVLVEWECSAVAELSRMGARGVKLNIPYVNERISALIEQRKALWALLVKDGCTNPGSPKACIKYIYGTKQVPLPAYQPLSPLFTEKGSQRAASGEPVTLADLSASEDAIDAIIDSSEEIRTSLKLLIDYKRVNKMCSTLESLLDHSAYDGRIHTQLNIATTTGRRSSSNPNIQNLSFGVSPDNVAGDMSGVLIGDEGFTLVEIDLQGAENWAAAMVAGDDAMAAACAAEDFHSVMAAGYFGARWENADKDERKRLRRMGKTVTFGVAYGLGKRKLALTLGISEAEAQEILDAKNRVFWATADAKRMAENKAKTTGYIHLWTGRKVPVPPDQLYVCWDYLLQGCVAELVKRAIVLISNAYRDNNLRSYIAHDMHDALILSVHRDEWESAIGIASYVMETVIPSEYNARTTPPIQWIARPDYAQNAAKWGRFQWHPSDSTAEPVDPPQNADLEANPVQEPVLEVTIPELLLDEDTPAPVQRIEVPSLGWRWQGRVRLDVAPKYWTRSEKLEAIRCLIALLMEVDHRLRQPTEVTLPVRTATGIGVGDPISVPYAERFKIPLIWAQLGEQGIDTEALLGDGMTPTALMDVATRRKLEIDSLNAVIERCVEGIARLEEQIGVKPVELAEVEL